MKKGQHEKSPAWNVKRDRVNYGKSAKYLQMYG